MQDLNQGTKAMFEDYAKACALKTNWKYWVFAQLMKPLGESFDKILGTSNFDHTANNAMVWLDQSFSLPQMRSLMTDQLKDLSVSSATLLTIILMQHNVNIIRYIEREKQGYFLRRCKLQF